ncbi:MAG: hypothetical protein EAZ97_02330 [Bacteroidetes bacterium]|nr:MAG: hypothetical protein EAZ97_02330 [Bacteroidota bacterium]
MLPLIKFLWLASMLIFLVILLVTYMYLPEQVNLFVAELGKIDKQIYFYSYLLILLVSNVSIIFLGKMLPFLPKNLILVPQKNEWLAEKNNEILLFKNLNYWVKGLGFIINIFLIISLLSIYTLNDSFVKYPTTWLYLLIPILFVGWFVVYFNNFSSPPKD